MTSLENDLLTYLRGIEKPENIGEIKRQKQFSEISDKQIAEALMQLRSTRAVHKSLEKGKICFSANTAEEGDDYLGQAIDLLSNLQALFKLLS